MDYLGGIREEEGSMNDSSLHKHRKPFKKQKANSIVYGDTIHDTKEGFQQKISVVTRPLHMARHEHNKPAGSAELPGKNTSSDKVNYNNELHKLLNHHKKIESFDKVNSLGQRSSISKTSKFFLNNSLKGFQFKHPGKGNAADSVSKRSPSFSNSNLPTDLPSNKFTKIGSISNSSRPLFSTNKAQSSGKEKTLHIKTFQQNIFEDFKAYSYFKNSMQKQSRKFVNLKYPYYFENTHLNSNYDSERNKRTTDFDEGVFEKANLKSFSKWKEEMRRKVDIRRNVSKSPLHQSEICAILAPGEVERS